jgi:hypothetical protein
LKCPKINVQNKLHKTTEQEIISNMGTVIIWKSACNIPNTFDEFELIIDREIHTKFLLQNLKGKDD